ncbi:hypothetical protein Pelo_5331 [Pelomyxa schiedti]|nr:hypothetical protein Pelo_5331 [Pelomyxa schiedti]
MSTRGRSASSQGSAGKLGAADASGTSTNLDAAAMWNRPDERDETIASLTRQAERLQLQVASLQLQVDENNTLRLRSAFRKKWISRGFTADEFADLHMGRLGVGLSSSSPPSSDAYLLREWLSAGESSHTSPPSARLINCAVASSTSNLMAPANANASGNLGASFIGSPGGGRRGLWDEEIERAVTEWLESGAEIPNEPPSATLSNALHSSRSSLNLDGDTLREAREAFDGRLRSGGIPLSYSTPRLCFFGGGGDNNNVLQYEDNNPVVLSQSQSQYQPQQLGRLEDAFQNSFSSCVTPQYSGAYSSTLSDDETSWDGSVEGDEWEAAGTSQILSILGHLEQLRLAKREKKRAAWIRSEFSSRWLVDRTMEEFALLYMRGIDGLPERTRATRLREWYQEGTAIGPKSAVCAWVPDIEATILSWLFLEGGVPSEPDWDEELEKDDTSSAPIVRDTQPPNQDMQQIHESRIANLEAENDALRKNIEKCTGEYTTISQQNVQLAEELERVHTELDEARAEELKWPLIIKDLQMQLHEANKLLCEKTSETVILSQEIDRLSQYHMEKEKEEIEEEVKRNSVILKDFVLEKWLSHHTIEDFVTEHMKEVTEIPPRSKIARFRQWLQGSHLSGWEEVIEKCVNSWKNNYTAEPIVIQEPEAPALMECSPCILSPTCTTEEILLELKILRSRLAEIESAEEEKQRRTHSGSLRDFVKESWLATATSDEFADMYMCFIPGIPERSRRARFREWLEEQPTMWDSEIEYIVEQFIADKVPALGVEEGPVKAIAQLIQSAGEGGESFLECLPPPLNWKRECEGLSKEKEELESYISYLEKDQASLQEDMEDLRERYFLAIGLTLKLQGMNLGVPIKDLYVMALESQCDYSDYEKFLCTLLEL